MQICNARANLIEGGKLSIKEFINHCKYILPDNYLLWADVFINNKIEKDLLSTGVKREKIVNFTREYSDDIVTHFKQYANENCEEIATHLKEIFKTVPEKYIDYKIDAYIYFWIVECYIKLLRGKTNDVNYYIILARLASGQGKHEEAKEAVDRLILLNKSLESSTLRRMSFVLTYRCNLRCKHCWIYNEDSFERHHMDEHLAQSELTSDEVITIITKSKLLRKADVSFTGGEIFIRKDIDKILYALASAGIKYEIFTNGTFPDYVNDLLSDKKIRDSVKAVVLSFDGDRTTHDSIRGKGVFDKLIKTIEVLKSRGVRIRLNTVIMEQNIDKLEEISKLANKLECFNHDFNLQVQGGKYLSLPDIRKIRPYMYANTFFRILEEDKYNGIGCLAGITRCSVTPNGLVETCSTSKIFSHFILGNLYDYKFDFDSLWTSDAAQKTRFYISNCPGCANHCERG